MHWRMDRLDWNQLKAFLETAETGALSAAARKLGLTQPTLSRQVAAIEKQLGVTLFERVGKAMARTGTGLALLDHARAMGAAAEELQGPPAAGRRRSTAWCASRPATWWPRTCCRRCWPARTRRRRASSSRSSPRMR